MRLGPGYDLPLLYGAALRPRISRYHFRKKKVNFISASSINTVMVELSGHIKQLIPDARQPTTLPFPFRLKNQNMDSSVNK